MEWNRGTQYGARSRCHHLNSISLNPSFQPPTTGIIARPRITILHSIPLSVNVYESNSTAHLALSSGCVACLPAPRRGFTRGGGAGDHDGPIVDHSR